MTTFLSSYCGIISFYMKPPQDLLCPDPNPVTITITISVASLSCSKMSKSMKYVIDFRSVPGHREAPYARIIDIRYFSEETNKTGMRAIDAVMTILYHYDIKQLNVFLDPVVTTFNFSGNTLGFDVIIRRRAKVVTVSSRKLGCITLHWHRVNLDSMLIVMLDWIPEGWPVARGHRTLQTQRRLDWSMGICGR